MEPGTHCTKGPKATAVWSSPSLCGAEVQVSRHLVGQLLVEQAVQGGELLVVGGRRVEEGQGDEDVAHGAVGQLGQHSAQAHQQQLQAGALTLRYICTP
jgi:hypothetical protein